MYIKYVIGAEKSDQNADVYVLDLPGYVAADETQEEAVRLIREAMELYGQSM